MEVFHGVGGEEREKRENEPCSAEASVLRYCVITEDTGKAIIKKHYGNFNFNVPASVLTTLLQTAFSLLQTDINDSLF